MTTRAARRPDIFISYRRDDGGHARALYEKLRDWFDDGELFLDHENLDPGAKFRPELEAAVKGCKVFLAVIGPHWLSDKNQARLQEADDVTRGEIRTALETGKILIPVLAGGAGFPDVKRLPADIAAISEDNAHHQLEAQYRASFQKLLDTLQYRYQLTPQYRRRDGSRQPFHTNRELPSPHFADPTGKLPALRETLAKGGSAALTAATVQGMGGVGKTQLALKYSHAFRDEYEGVWWFRSEETALLEQDCEELCRDRAISRFGEEPHSQSALRWLKSQPRWLLVYDNAEDPRAIRPYLPESGIHHVLITSRNPNWGAIVKGGQLDLETWSDKQALVFLNSRLEDIPDDDLKGLSQALGGLPLALEMAAAYPLENGRDVAAYLSDLADVEEAPRLLEQDTPANGYPHTVLAALTLAVEKLTPAAVQLIALCGWLAPEDIPESMFTGHGEALPEDLAPAAAKPNWWNETVGKLERYGLCSRFEIPSLEAGAPKGKMEKALQFHRLTQEAVRAKLGGPENLAAAMALLQTAFPAETDNPKYWPTQAALLPHVRGMERFGALPGFDYGRHAWLLDRAASYLQHGPAIYPEARRMFEQALEICRRVLGEIFRDHLAWLLEADPAALGASEKNIREQLLQRQATPSPEP